jgi:hypothetical protein
MKKVQKCCSKYFWNCLYEMLFENAFMKNILKVPLRNDFWKCHYKKKCLYKMLLKMPLQNVMFWKCLYEMLCFENAFTKCYALKVLSRNVMLWKCFYKMLCFESAFMKCFWKYLYKMLCFESAFTKCYALKLSLPNVILWKYLKHLQRKCF